MNLYYHYIRLHIYNKLILSLHNNELILYIKINKSSFEKMVNLLLYNEYE